MAVGADVSRFVNGDKVCALIAGGGYAEYCVVHETNALPVPGALFWNEAANEAAAILETFFTVWTNVFQRGRLTAGEMPEAGRWSIRFSGYYMPLMGLYYGPNMGQFSTLTDMILSNNTRSGSRRRTATTPAAG